MNFCLKLKKILEMLRGTMIRKLQEWGICLFLKYTDRFRKTFSFPKQVCRL